VNTQRWKKWWQRNKRFLMERRSAERKPIGTIAEIWWTDQSGTRLMMQAVCVDVSSGGLGVISSTPPPPGRPLSIKMQSRDGIKVTSVMHCQQLDNAYLTGMKFC
jgi:hypothetical protein